MSKLVWLAVAVGVLTLVAFLPQFVDFPGVTAVSVVSSCVLLVVEAYLWARNSTERW